MDSELVSHSSLSFEDNNATSEGSERVNRSAPFSYTKMFKEWFPFYLSIGMTPEQYWEGDSTLVIYYRKAEDIRKERVNQEAWLQGMYIYDAIGRLSPILRSFAKKGTKPQPYVEEAYPINTQANEERQKRKEKQTMVNNMQKMQAFMVANNKRFKNKESDGKNVNDNRTT